MSNTLDDTACSTKGPTREDSAMTRTTHSAYHSAFLKGKLILSLRKPGQEEALDNAIVKFPASYEEGVASACDVFKLSNHLPTNGSVDHIELRYPISIQGAASKSWAKVLASQWSEIVDGSTPEMGVFVLGDKAPPGYEENTEKQVEKSSHLAGKQEKMMMHLVTVKNRLLDQEERFVVPLAESYEDCLSAAYDCFSSLKKLKKKCKRSSIALSGRYPSVNGKHIIVGRITTPAAYSQYVTHRHSKNMAVELVVSFT